MGAVRPDPILPRNTSPRRTLLSEATVIWHGALRLAAVALALVAVLSALFALPVPAHAQDEPLAPTLEQEIVLDGVPDEGANSASLQVTDDGAFALVSQYQSNSDYPNYGQYTVTVVNLENGEQHQFADKRLYARILNNTTAFLMKENGDDSELMLLDLASGDIKPLELSKSEEAFPDLGLIPLGNEQVILVGIEANSNSYTNWTLQASILDIASQEIVNSCNYEIFNLDQRVTSLWLERDLSKLYLSSASIDEEAFIIQGIDLASGNILFENYIDPQEVKDAYGANGFNLFDELDNGALVALAQSDERQPVLIDPTSGEVSALSRRTHRVLAYNDNYFAVLEASSGAPGDELEKGDLVDAKILIIDAEGTCAQEFDLPKQLTDFPISSGALSQDGRHLYILGEERAAEGWLAQTSIVAIDTQTGSSVETANLSAGQSFFGSSLTNPATYLTSNDGTIVGLIRNEGDFFSIQVYKTGIEANPLAELLSEDNMLLALGIAGGAVLLVVAAIAIAVVLHRRKKAATRSGSIQGAVPSTISSGAATPAFCSQAGIGALTQPVSTQPVPVPPSTEHHTSSAGIPPQQAYATSTPRPPAPRFCTHCGAPLPQGAKFCGSCGRPVK